MSETLRGKPFSDAIHPGLHRMAPAADYIVDQSADQTDDQTAHQTNDQTNDQTADQTSLYNTSVL